MAEEDVFPPAKDRMSRARTPFGAVPISTIYGFDYPLSNGTTRDFSEHAKISDSVDHLITRTRAMSEMRSSDPYYSSMACSGLSYMPMALRASRSITPIRDPTPLREPSTSRYTAPPAPARSERVKEALKEVNDIPRTTTISYSSTTPWNSTGFYYSPRYPQSHRGTASTYYNNAYARRYFDDFNYYNPHAYKLDYFRYPVRRFVPSYVPFRYSRRF